MDLELVSLFCCFFQRTTKLTLNELFIWCVIITQSHPDVLCMTDDEVKQEVISIHSLIRIYFYIIDIIGITCNAINVYFCCSAIWSTGRHKYFNWPVQFSPVNCLPHWSFNVSYWLDEVTSSVFLLHYDCQLEVVDVLISYCMG